MTISILLADDHDIIRDGLRALIEKEPGMAVTAQARNGREAVRLALEHKPAVIIMDINMPQLNGIEASRQILSDLPGARIIILSVYSEKHYVAGALRAGVKGYLLKSCAFDELVGAVHAVAKNQGYLSSRITSIVMEDYSGGMTLDEGPQGFSSLTFREKEVLHLIGEGAESKQIAARLCVSIKTVSTHRRHIMEKLNATSTADLVKAALRAGLISLDD